MFRVAPIALLILIGTLGVPSFLCAQATREELQARIERLTQMLEEARRQEAEAMYRHDTVQVGPLIAIAPPDRRERAATLLSQAWNTLQERFGTDAAVINERYYAYGVPGEAWPPGPTFLDIVSEGEIIRDVDRSLRARLDPSEIFLDEFPVTPMGQKRKGAVYVQLVTAQSHAVASCFEGDIRACRDALTLTELSDPVTAWYSPEEQRQLLEGWIETSWIPDRVTDTRSLCLEGDEHSCLQALHSVSPWALRPLDETARRLLVEVALEAGGDGALQRMLAPGTMSVEDRLVAAAGVDADSLVAAWRTEVIGSGSARASRSPRVSLFAASATFAWLLVFIFLSTRSTRWRSG